MQRSYVVAVFASIIGMAFGMHAASAQDVTTPSGYQFFVTPYLWLASVHATTLPPLAHAPQVNSNVSTIDLLSHLDGAPFMGSFEVRYGNLGFLADAIHLPVSTKITTHDIFVEGGAQPWSASRCERDPQRRLDRSADRRAISPRARQRLRADGLWRCRRL